MRVVETSPASAQGIETDCLCSSIVRDAGVNFQAARAGRLPLGALFFVQAHATGLWMVTFSNVLKTHGLEPIIPYAFACSALAAFISPLFIGSLADEHISPARLLRWLATGTAFFLALAFLAIERGWGITWVLIFFQLQALFSAPTWGVSTSIGLSALSNPAREFGPIRVWATFGWMAAGSMTSYLLQADDSPRAGLVASLVWLGVAALSYSLPETARRAEKVGRSWRELFGLDALVLLRHRDHGMVFITAALVSIPLSAFYPFAAMQLRDLGQPHVAAAMSLGQVTEIISMYALAPLLARFRMKWVLLTGIGFGVVRYALFTLNNIPAMFAGITLHGVCFTLFYIPAQIYLDRRIDRRLHARAQALLTLMVSGAGTLAGYLGCGWWREACTTARGTEWPLYWSVLCGVLVAVFAFFAIIYQGIGRVEKGEAPVKT